MTIRHIEGGRLDLSPRLAFAIQANLGVWVQSEKGKIKLLEKDWRGRPYSEESYKLWIEESSKDSNSLKTLHENVSALATQITKAGFESNQGLAVYAAVLHSLSSIATEYNLIELLGGDNFLSYLNTLFSEGFPNDGTKQGSMTETLLKSVYWNQSGNFTSDK